MHISCHFQCLHYVLQYYFQLLLLMIWLRHYPTMASIASQFGISVSCIHKIIHRLLPILHNYVVPKYIRWHSMQHWRRLRGTFPEWPRVVAIIDGTPFRISRPKGMKSQWRNLLKCHDFIHLTSFFIIQIRIAFNIKSRKIFREM